MMLRRLLIANRGEIAIRIVHACRELGIESVAVYSDADVRARHVAAADIAVRIGPAPAAESYLSIPRILEAIRATGADAVHPGYGFLSENAAFAARCEESGITFVGAPASVIARMGSKIEARRLMQSTGVPIVPGDTPADQSDDGIRKTIDRVGLPALVKASAGGGGMGMRHVESPAEIVAAVQAARREAAAAFGDSTLYVERVIPHARHIEVQIFADGRGGVVHLFERECSIQRRHQKVIEESPSPAVSPALRQQITEAAVRAAKSCGYRNAGTIEFLVEHSSSGSGRFYFLEMNTRLQVEHPVTEQVTGVDLVRAQLLVAGGEPMPWSASALTARGHAIEARVYAEDPQHRFLPQAGPLLLYREPQVPGVRIDSGVGEGDEVTVHYDPLLAKVIASGETREEAVARLHYALGHYAILGIRTNIPFLIRLLEHPRVRDGDLDTTFLDREADGMIHEMDDEEMPGFIQAAVAAYDNDDSDVQGAKGPSHHIHDPWRTLREWRA
jgi:acetyl-CoA carboxylase biotin carboxylase subunit